VVTAGLQLAVEASGQIRRGSLYIGLLALGAFGPTTLAAFAVLARILGDPEAADAFALDPFEYIAGRPDLDAAAGLLIFLTLVGFLVLVALSVDAQAIAISLLGGVASGRPLSLAQAVTRARQTFWRLLGASIIVGLASGIVAFVFTLPFGGLNANPATSFVASLIGTLAVTPWIYAATGVVLGDVGAVESLRRSVSLFQASRRVALVVVLFTLVTAAIQSFALGAGAEVAVRIGELFGLGNDDGSGGLVLPAVLVLAFIVAIGSLTFTIAAIVAAPQVVAFLGLTFYSGGLDRARAAGRRAGPLHWIAPPLALAIVGVTLLSVLAVLGVGAVRR
jgi:hypothetical protein